MTEEEKQALRNSFAGKKGSEMTPEERELFDEEFQYSFSNKPKQKPAFAKSQHPSKPKDLTMGFLSRMNLIEKKQLLQPTQKLRKKIQQGKAAYANQSDKAP